jgi:hypothetical protein
MRRALLLATLLAVPALVRAQVQVPNPGQIIFVDRDADLNGQKINAIECNSPTATVQTIFAPTVAAPAAGVTYQMYASNQAQTGSTTTDLNTTCLTDQQSNTTNNLRIVKVGDQLVNPVSLVDVAFATSQIAQALVPSTGSGDPCAGSGETTIFLCIQGQASGVNFGVARGTMSLSLTRPDIVNLHISTPVQPGNTRLTPSWSPSGTAVTTHFQVQAISVADPTNLPTASAFDPAGGYTAFDPLDTQRHTSAVVSGNTVTLSGLKNDVTYALVVTGFTDAYNPSDPSPVVSGAPQFVNDFWNIYKDAGGRETGGCASGMAGPLGLLLLAGTLALVRRRK